MDAGYVLLGSYSRVCGDWYKQTELVLVVACQLNQLIVENLHVQLDNLL